MCAVLHGGVIRIFQNGGQKFCMKSSTGYIVFHNYFVFSEEKLYFLPKFTFSGPISFVINVSLFISVVCYCQNGLRRKHGKCSFFMQRMMTLLYEPMIESSCVVV